MPNIQNDWEDQYVEILDGGRSSCIVKTDKGLRENIR